MQCVVYLNGKILKWYNGSKKNCMIYMQGAAEGLEVAGARLNFSEGAWTGHSANGLPIAIFLYQPT